MTTKTERAGWTQADLDALRAAEVRKTAAVEAVIAHARAWGGMQHTAEVDDLLAADDALRALTEKETGR